MARFETLVRAFARDGLDRGVPVVALGGGVVSDLAGFVAASYLRGVALYVMPTSVLAMVDASVGGKTAVNLSEGKNLVGAFWQPRAVIADVSTLRTLPDREFRLGAVEAFKHGLLADETLLEILNDPDFLPRGEPEVLIDRIARSVRVKADVVASDEREAGARAHLNLGHTLGHALEAVTDHRLPHGDAVAYGLLYAAVLGQQRGYRDWSSSARRLIEWLEPQALPDVDFEALEPYIQRDKKNRLGRVRFVLLEAIGRPVVVDDVTREEQRAAWTSVRELWKGQV
jgi:3-dehydroquinate synthase